MSDIVAALCVVVIPASWRYLQEEMETVFH